MNTQLKAIGVYNEKNINILFLHMFLIIFAFAGCSPSKKDSVEATTTQEIATTTSTTEITTDSSTSDSDAKR